MTMHEEWRDFVRRFDMRQPKRRLGLARPPVSASRLSGDAALKGPAGKIMRKLSHKRSCLGVVEFSVGPIDHLVINRCGPDRKSKDSV